MSDKTNSFDQILGTCIQEVTEQGKTVEECLQRFPEYRQELEPLLRLSLRLKNAQSVQAPEEFRQSAETRLQNLIAASPRTRQKPAVEEAPTLLSGLAGVFQKIGQGLQPGKYPIFAAALVLVVIFLSISGVSYAAGSALPGEQLYPIKTWMETARLELTSSDYSAIRLHLQYADLRLSEAAGLSTDIEQATSPLRAYQKELQAASTLLKTSTELTTAQKTYVAGEMVHQLPEHGMTLSGLAKIVPEHLAGFYDQIYRQMLVDYQLATRILQENASLIDLPDELPAIPTLAFQHPTQAASTSFPTMPGFPTIEPLPSGTITVWIMNTPWPTGCPTAWPVGWPDEWKNCHIDEWPTDIPKNFPTSWPTYWPTNLQTYLPVPWQTLVPTLQTLPSLIPTVRYLPTYMGTIINLLPTLPPVPGNWPTVQPPPGWPPDDDDGPSPGNPEPPPGFPKPPVPLPHWP